jgi:hypothetical protein
MKLLHIADIAKPILLPLTQDWQKWWFSATQKHLWLIQVWFSASTFVVKIASFAKTENVLRNLKNIQPKF